MVMVENVAAGISSSGSRRQESEITTPAAEPLARQQLTTSGSASHFFNTNSMDSHPTFQMPSNEFRPNPLINVRPDESARNGAQKKAGGASKKALRHQKSDSRKGRLDLMMRTSKSKSQELNASNELPSTPKSKSIQPASTNSRRALSTDRSMSDSDMSMSNLSMSTHSIARTNRKDAYMEKRRRLSDTSKLIPKPASHAPGAAKAPEAADLGPRPVDGGGEHDPEKAKVRAWLKDLNCDRFYDIFIEEGGESLELIKYFVDEDLVEMGLSPDQRKIVNAAIKELPDEFL
jgi:hypothetical protein